MSAVCGIRVYGGVPVRPPGAAGRGGDGDPGDLAQPHPRPAPPPRHPARPPAAGPGQGGQTHRWVDRECHHRSQRHQYPCQSGGSVVGPLTASCPLSPPGAVTISSVGSLPLLHPSFQSCRVPPAPVQFWVNNRMTTFSWGHTAIILTATLICGSGDQQSIHVMV